MQRENPTGPLSRAATAPIGVPAMPASVLVIPAALTPARP